MIRHPDLKPPAMPVLETGVPNFDAILGGGLPAGCVTIIAGPPGSGKTILSQQIGFKLAVEGGKVLFFYTLSEPTVKSLHYARQFAFFDAERLNDTVRFIDVGTTLREHGLEATSLEILRYLKEESPTFVVIDSFRSFDNRGGTPEERRNFGYGLAVNLIAWQCTALLLGEFSAEDIATNPIFSVVDALILMNQEESSGEQQRMLKIVKMRGANHNRDKHPFVISSLGIELYAPRVTLRRDAGLEPSSGQTPRMKTGMATFDTLLGAGISYGSSVAVCGESGTGKTLLLLEFIYRGASEAGEKGIFISFEETRERIVATARGFGWDLEAQIAKGLIEILFIPQPDVLIEADLLNMDAHIRKAGIKRVAIDSLSGFLHKVQRTELIREKLFQLATIVQNTQAVGFFSTDLPRGNSKNSRFQMEATIVDGVVFLTAPENGLERERYLEVYKLRNTAHTLGKHAMTIGFDGIKLAPPRSGR